jgi:hypothetical protein
MEINLESSPPSVLAPGADRPQPGDVIVQALDRPPLLYGLGVYPSSLQQPCGMYEQAERHGLALAQRFGVDLWRLEADGRFVAIRRCRDHEDHG